MCTCIHCSERTSYFLVYHCIESTHNLNYIVPALSVVTCEEIGSSQLLTISLVFRYRSEQQPEDWSVCVSAQRSQCL